VDTVKFSGQCIKQWIMYNTVDTLSYSGHCIIEWTMYYKVDNQCIIKWTMHYTVEIAFASYKWALTTLIIGLNCMAFNFSGIQIIDTWVRFILKLICLLRNYGILDNLCAVDRVIWKHGEKYSNRECLFPVWYFWDKWLERSLCHRAVVTSHPPGTGGVLWTNKLMPEP